MLRPSQTKIIATVGPAILSVEKLVELIQAGVDVFRINAAHGTIDSFASTLALIRQAEKEADAPIAVLMDLAGPKMRLGEIEGGELDCVQGEKIRFIRGKESPQKNWLTSTYEPLVDELNVGDRVLMCDGLVSVEITEKGKDYVEGVVVQPGVVRCRQGINLPGVKLSVKSLQPVDITNAIWAVQNGIDYLGFSFVRTAEEIDELRDILVANKPTGKPLNTGIIAKIEKPEAVENLEQIALASDGVMVARGDLGVEVDIAKMGVVQKEIIRVCRALGKPVIVATQMLESMTHSRIPTRAEASDVANAVFDGADCIMLSGETAVGDYPVETVKTMHRIALETEKERAKRDDDTMPELPCFYDNSENTLLRSCSLVACAMAEAAVSIADTTEASAIIAATSTGRTALDLALMRSSAPTIGCSPVLEAARRLALFWGVIPMYLPEAKNYADIVAEAKKRGYVETGEAVVLLTGQNVFKDSYNAVAVIEVQ